MQYDFRVTCEEHYYGKGCGSLCRPRDDQFGHYQCSELGDRVCLAGWQGDYCTKRKYTNNNINIAIIVSIVKCTANRLKIITTRISLPIDHAVRWDESWHSVPKLLQPKHSVCKNILVFQTVSNNPDHHTASIEQVSKCARFFGLVLLMYTQLKRGVQSCQTHIIWYSLKMIHTAKRIIAIRSPNAVSNKLYTSTL